MSHLHHRLPLYLLNLECKGRKLQDLHSFRFLTSIWSYPSSTSDDVSIHANNVKIERHDNVIAHTIPLLQRPITN